MKVTKGTGKRAMGNVQKTYPWRPPKSLKMELTLDDEEDVKDEGSKSEKAARKGENKEESLLQEIDISQKALETIKVNLEGDDDHQRTEIHRETEADFLELPERGLQMLENIQQV